MSNAEDFPAKTDSGQGDTLTPLINIALESVVKRVRDGALGLKIEVQDIVADKFQIKSNVQSVLKIRVLSRAGGARADSGG